MKKIMFILWLVMVGWVYADMNIINDLGIAFQVGKDFKEINSLYINGNFRTSGKIVRTKDGYKRGSLRPEKLENIVKRNGIPVSVWYNEVVYKPSDLGCFSIIKNKNEMDYYIEYYEFNDKGVPFLKWKKNIALFDKNDGYTIEYKNYIFDEFGSWISREGKMSDYLNNDYPNTIKQHRIIEY